MADDAQLMREYADHGSGEAFRELVRRNAGLVYSAALRRLNGDAHRARDVTQEVFVLLARKSRALRRHPTLAGWLFATTHFKASEAIRAERRRRTREQESHAMLQSTNTSGEPPWERVRPLLDEAMLELRARDREAVLLRYFQSRPYVEIAERFGVGESAAKKCVDRALDRLRAGFARRGLESSAVTLGAVLTSQAATSVPAGVVVAAGNAAIAAGVGGLWSTIGVYSLPIMTTGNKLAAIAALSLVANLAMIGTGVVRVSQEMTESDGTAAARGGATVPAGASSRGMASAAPTVDRGVAELIDAMRLPLADRIARLRSLGVPREVLRQYAIDEVLKKYEPRYRAIMHSDEPLPPYWTREASSASTYARFALGQKLPAFFKDVSTELRGLIGDDAIYSVVEEERNAMYRAWGNLPPGKLLDLADANLELVSERAKALLEPNPQAKLAEIAKRESEIKSRLLTTEELRRSEIETASDLRAQLAGFNPSQEEFDLLVPLLRDFQSRYGTTAAIPGSADSERWINGRRELIREASRRLGAERAAQFQLAIEPDGTAGSMTRVVARLGLPFIAAEQLRQLQVKVQAEAAAARVRGPNETFPTVNQRVSRQLEEFEAQATELLGGSEGFEAYRLAAGEWLRFSFDAIGTFATDKQKQFFR